MGRPWDVNCIRVNCNCIFEPWNLPGEGLLQEREQQACFLSSKTAPAGSNAYAIDLMVLIMLLDMIRSLVYSRFYRRFSLE